MNGLKMEFVSSAVQKLGTVAYAHELAKSFGDEVEGEIAALCSQ
jgi:hypothetical protein